ncbi:MAG: tetratricopeptide repeat protein [Victivallales bacterium]|nr:tetratricopeptide repeat protein [Victivallales bacterium]
MLSAISCLWRLPHDLLLLLLDAPAALIASLTRAPSRRPGNQSKHRFCRIRAIEPPEGEAYSFCERADRYYYPRLFGIVCPHCVPKDPAGDRLLRCGNRHNTFRVYWGRLLGPVLVIAAALALVYFTPTLLGHMEALTTRPAPARQGGSQQASKPSVPGQPSGGAAQVVPAEGQANPKQSASGPASRARALLADGRYDVARGPFLEAIRRQPQNVDLRLEFAALARRTGDRQLATDHLRTAVLLAPKRADVRYAFASILALQLEYEKCLPHASEAARAEPENGLYRSLHAQALLALGRSPEALAEAEAAIKQTPTGSEPRLILANSLLAAGKYHEAEEHFRSVLRDDKAEKRALVGVARVRTLQRKLDEAEKILHTLALPIHATTKHRFNLAEKILPHYTGFTSLTRFSVPRFQVEPSFRLQGRVAEAQTELAEAYYALRQAPKALAILRKLTEDHPQLLTIRARYAQMLAKTGNGNEAYLLATNLIVDAPRDVGAHLVLAELFFDRRLYDRAEEQAKLALQGDSNDLRRPSAHQLLARACIRQQDYAQATEHFSLLVEQLPGLIVGHLQLAACQEAAKNYATARKTLEDACERFPQDSRPPAALGAFFLRRQEEDLAIEAFRKALGKQPTDATAYNRLAAILADRKQTKEALAYALVAFKAQPNHWGVLDTLGWIHCRSGDTAAGLPYLNQALALAPRNPEIQYHLGYALAKSGQPDAARWHLEVALRTSTPFPWLDEAKATLAALPDK